MFVSYPYGWLIGVKYLNFLDSTMTTTMTRPNANEAIEAVTMEAALKRIPC